MSGKAVNRKLQELTRPCRKRAEQILHVRSGYKHTGILGSWCTRVHPHRRLCSVLSHTSRTVGLTPVCGPVVVAFNSATARSAGGRGIYQPRFLGLG